jgi:DNA-binding NarL/FixJ family response regulator
MADGERPYPSEPTERRESMTELSDLKRVTKLLFVEDHAVFRETFTLLLERQMDVDCVRCSSLDETHTALRGLNGEIELAIVDLDLPDEKGFQLIEELRERQPNVPVLALTIGRWQSRHAKALETGADEVCILDLSIEELIEAVRRLGFWSGSKSLEE